MCVCVCVFIQGFFPGRGKDFERELLLTQVHYYISRFLFNLPTKYWTNCYCMNKNSEYLREGIKLGQGGSQYILVCTM